ncbi:acylphosphatase [Candidatus Dependentiae bacterium]|nr:acylphosphatase [Candidatus Dependentiae bacterium]
MRRCSRIVVRGKVQGVLYRDFVKKHAEELKIEGTVQNSNDGAVVINACGSSEKFEDFIDVLYKGPPKSHVEAVAEEPITHERDFRGVFRIIGSK